MRPLRLELEGFTSFRERAVVNFEDADLFVFTGATGAGKSSLIDAMIFAMYGAVPRYDHRSLVTPAISQGKVQARVRFDFETGGRVFTAVRVVRRLPAGGATTKEATLEERVGDDPSKTLARTAADLTECIERDIIGLSLEHFTKCVVLPQGRFASFLRAKPADRLKLLVELLGLDLYGRIRERALNRFNSLDREGHLIRERLETELADATDEAVAQAQKRVDVLDGVRHRIRSGREQMDQIAVVIHEAGARLEGSRRARDLLGLVRVPDNLDDLTKEMDRAQRTVERAAREVVEATLERDAAARVRGALPERSALDQVRQRRRELADLEDRLARTQTALDEASHALEQARAQEEQALQSRTDADSGLGELPKRAELDRVIERRAELAQVRGRLDETRAQALAAEEAARHAIAQAKAAQDRLDGAEKTLEQLRLRHGAANLARHLVVGEDCPVCLREVMYLPDREGPAEPLAAAEEARDAVKAEATQVAHDVREAEARHGDARAVLRELDTRASLLGTSLAAAPTLEGAAALLESVADAEQRVRDADVVLTTARGKRQEREVACGEAKGTMRALQKARQGLVRALEDAPGPEEVSERMAEVDAAEGAEAAAVEMERSRHRAHAKALERAGALELERRSAWRAYRDMRDTVAELGPPPAPEDDLAGSWLELDTWARERLGEEGRVIGEARTQRNDATTKWHLIHDKLHKACREHGLEVGEDETPESVCAEALGEAGLRLRNAKSAVDAKERLGRQLTRVDERAQVAKTLHVHLKATGFGRWLQNRVLNVLVAGASEKLRELSSGQYSLDLDERNEFLVIDHHNAGEARTAKTLSGGETFLAALALALSMATEIMSHRVGGGGKLEALFLDEGFGALDPDTLEVVATSIEQLGADRVVGLVTHVRELADRVPVQFRVTKIGNNSSVERVEE